MRHLCWVLGLLVCLVAPAALAASPNAAKDAGPKPPVEVKAAPAAPEAKAPDIAPEAAGPVHAMCDYLKTKPAFAFTAELATEEVYPNGQTVQVSREVSVVVQRPDKIASHVVGDDRNRVFLYDGKTVTVADLDRGVYAVTDAPPTIDATLDMLSEKYGMNAPLGDLLYADPCAEMLENVRTGDCVGSHRAAGKICDHLAFAQKNADWQLWVEKGKSPLPRKLVINDKEVMGWPQYAATFTNWDMNPHLAPGLFTFTPTKDMRRIDFLPLVSGQGQTK